MASRRVSSSFQPPQEHDDDEEEEENESDTYSEDDTSSSDTYTEPEVAVNHRDSAIEVGEETEEEEEASEEEQEEEIKGRVKNGEQKGREDVGIELGNNSVLPTCPVCMEPWTSEGPHRVCCIPCGHVYGRLCLEKWLRKCGNKGKCPQCNGKFNPKQIINLYAPRIVVPNDDLEKEVKSLREKTNPLLWRLAVYLKARLLEEISKQRELFEEQQSKRQKIRQTSLLEFSDQSQKLSIGVLSGSTATIPGRIVLRYELPFDGARVMVIDASNQTLMVSSKAPGIPCEHVLNKVSLLCPGEVEKIKLPNNTKTVKDLCVLPNGLVALASLGRKLAVFSKESNNFVLQYDLPAPAWSCSGNDANAHYIYAGLQNGKLLVFDVRQTAQPVQSLDGLTTQPIHTVHSLNNDGASRVMTASSVGPCLWDMGPGAERPTLVPGLENHGICIALACGGDNVVASFRPRVDLCQPDSLSSQTLNSLSAPNLGKLGSHVLMKKKPDGMSFCKDQVCNGYLSELRMSKSAIICLDRNDPLFAYGDEMLRGVCIWGLPSFTRYADLNPHREPVLDLRYARVPSGPGFLGCLSEEKLQVFSCL